MPQNIVSTKNQARAEIADLMLVGAIPWYNEVEKSSFDYMLRGRNLEFFGSMAYLAQKGCDLRSLYVMLAMAHALKEKGNSCSMPKARDVKNWAKKMRRMAKGIRVFESDRFMTFLNRKEIAKWLAETGGVPEDIDDLSRAFPFLALPKWLEKRASMYENWSRLASQAVPPRNFGLIRLARVCLAMYVKYATARTHFPQVKTLLAAANMGTFKEAELSRELKKFEKGYPHTCGYLALQFRMLHPNPPRIGKLLTSVPEAMLKSSKRFHKHVFLAPRQAANSSGSNRR